MTIFAIRETPSKETLPFNARMVGVLSLSKEHKVTLPKESAASIAKRAKPREDALTELKGNREVKQRLPVSCRPLHGKDTGMILNTWGSLWEFLASISYAFGEILTGENLTPADVENAPSGRKLSFSLPDGDMDCSINDVGTLTGKTTTGECPVTLLIQAEGFVDKAIVSTVTVKDEQNATWEGFPEWKQWRQTGETISPGNVANEDGTVEKVFTSSEPSRCLVDESTGVLTVAGEGSCEISLTVSASGFITKIFKTNLGNLIYDVAKQNQLNPLTVSDPYGASPALEIPDATSLELVNAPTGKGAISYRSTTAGICEVSAEGTISAIGPGECVIQAQAAGENSPPSVWTHLVNFQITSNLPDLEAIVGFAYSSLTPKFSDSTPTLTAPYSSKRCWSEFCLFHNSAEPQSVRFPRQEFSP